MSRFGRRAAERGATSAEYALLAGFVVLVIVAGIGTFGVAANDWYGAMAGAVAAALP